MQQTEKEFIVPRNREKHQVPTSRSLSICVYTSHAWCLSRSLALRQTQLPTSQPQAHKHHSTPQLLIRKLVCAEHTCYHRSAGQSVVSTSESTQREEMPKSDCIDSSLALCFFTSWPCVCMHVHNIITTLIGSRQRRYWVHRWHSPFRWCSVGFCFVF